MHYTVTLSAEQLILQAETTALCYSGIVVSRAACAALCPIVQLTADGAESSLRESLRALLREPLKDVAFRKMFNEHFMKHPHDEIQDIAWPWMQEVLVWET